KKKGSTSFSLTEAPPAFYDLRPISPGSRIPHRPPASPSYHTTGREISIRQKPGSKEINLFQGGYEKESSSGSPGVIQRDVGILFFLPGGTHPGCCRSHRSRRPRRP